MKRSFLSTVAAVAVLSSSVFASKDVHIGVSQAEIFKKSTQVVNVGFGRDAIWDSGFMMGVAADLQMGDFSKVTDVNTSTSGAVTNDYFYGFSADVKIGYAPIKSLSIYGLGSVQVQTMGSTGGTGFGYGGGVNYAVTDSFAVSAEYKTYSMQFDGVLDYDYSTAGINMKYTWQ